VLRELTTNAIPHNEHFEVNSCNRCSRQESFFLGSVGGMILPMEEKSEQEGTPLLIQRVLAGKRELFHDLIRPYERVFFVLAYSVLRNREDAEEAVQQAMLNVFSRLSQLDDHEKFKQWAMRVVENEAKMSKRKRREHLYESIDGSAVNAAEEKPFRPRQFADWRDVPSDTVERIEVRQAIWKALGELPEMYREVFVLRDVQHLDVNETAQVLGIGESAVKTRLHRARLMMRESLTPMFANPKPSFWERWKGMNPWLAAKR
jgi:RNA polymerase sigma-70 factor (ECF subfamily)